MGSATTPAAIFLGMHSSAESPYHLTTAKGNHIINLSNVKKRTSKPIHLPEKRGLRLEAFLRNERLNTTSEQPGYPAVRAR
ncbi:MAG: hypothetical protein CVV03_10115 [Firmicutes bacterium HGW-Firmicutes-8]|nr:MAG: hypothetical protein CVV03_10115 [Firmicutes bacterium HGW-Firmicutes-8]